MANFTKAAATAQRLVEANGRQVVLIKTNRTPEDLAKPWRGTSADPDDSKGGGQVSVKMAFVPARGSGFGKMLADGEGNLVAMIDQIGLLASDSLSTGFTPEDVEQSDTVRDGDDVWKIVLREHLKPSTKSVLFVLGLKR